MKRFLNKTGFKSVDEAILTAEKLLDRNSEMIKDISKRDDFKFTDCDAGEVIAQRLWFANDVMPLTLWHPINPWTSAISSYKNGVCKMNARKVGSLSHAKLVGNLIHEWSHHCGFSHGNNYKTAEKVLYSVPYWLSENISQGRWL